ncbi:MAG: hypothetical protein II263_06865 [Lachnospiraceae bacterium]|nr:hypothetical protein [Lachnospiraceae bacterium]
MKKNNKSFVRRICVIVGSCLVIMAMLLPFFWQWKIRASERNMEYCVDTIRALIPEPQDAVLEERRDNAMPALSIDGTDYIGILEIPRYESALPVCGNWGEVSKHPSRLGGSVYDGTLQIGGTSQKGQYDFFREISVEEAVYFTDMEGNRYAYAVTDIHNEKHADQAALQREEAAMTLFIKNIYAFEYVVIHCNPLD